MAAIQTNNNFTNGTITTGGTAQVMSASKARQCLVIQNTSAGALWFTNSPSGAVVNPVVGTVGTLIAAGATWTSPANVAPKGTISIIGATTAQAFNYWEI